MPHPPTMPTDSLIIRQASTADLPSILALCAQLGQDDGRILSVEQAGAIFTRMQRYPDYHLHVACADGQVVGAFALLIMDNLGHLGAPSAIVEDVVVAEERRGLGIGKAMMAHAARIAIKRRCYKIMLSSNRNREAAHRFYESIGYVKHGSSYLLPLAPTDPGQASDEVL